MHGKRYGSCTLKELAIPFWRGDRVYYESVLPLSAVDETMPEARLLYVPDEIAEVRNARLDILYAEGEDWILEEGRLRFPSGTRIPLTSREELYPAEYVEGRVMEKTGGGYLLFSEGHFFHDKQIAVSYKHSGVRVEKPVLDRDTACLERTAGKLAASEPLKLLLFGDSIAVGANASGMTGAPPYLPVWGEMTAILLGEAYGSKVDFINHSVGGITSEGGLEILDRVLENADADLVILAFGMNDGSAKVPKEQYAGQILTMIEKVKAVNGSAEFILVSPILANPDSYFAGNQTEYIDELLRMREDGIAVADMTAVHRELLQYKSYADLTGNHVNHPNDFLARCYAQVLLTLLMDESPSAASRDAEPIRYPRT